MVDKTLDKTLEAGIIWYEEMLKDLGIKGLGKLEKDGDKGLSVTYNPELLTAHQAQEMIATAQRDGIFMESFLDVSNNKVVFRKEMQ